MDRDFGVDIGVVPGKLPFTFKTKYSWNFFSKIKA